MTTIRNYHTFLPTALLTLLFAGLMNVLSGCGSAGADYSKVDLIQVSGTVTLDGQPLPKAVVTFETPDGQFSYAMTDSSG
ncbi:MAG: carboxypeptidase regulatory-like domain-containing protein, partial [Planctomycetales bacterium]|nr:carboxypeptidase regulatory-like domain-containing protein [Planctomycetales bacterium]